MNEAYNQHQSIISWSKLDYSCCTHHSSLKLFNIFRANFLRTSKRLLSTQHSRPHESLSSTYKHLGKHQQKNGCRSHTVSMVSAKPPIHVLRGILRLLKRGDSSNIVATREYILEEYRRSKHISSLSKVQELQKLALDYYSLKEDLAERERLQKLDTGAEVQLSPKEMSRRAAARAGLQLPDVNLHET